MWRLNRVSWPWKKLWLLASAVSIFCLIACGCSNQAKSDSSSASAATAASPSIAEQPAQAGKPPEVAPPPDQTGGFDGAKAFDHVAKIVSFGPRPPASDAIHQVQTYIISQLKNFGCEVEQDDFHASTPIGDVAMKNIVAKAPGTGPGIILLLTHYDSLSSVKDFVGAEDSASSTGMMIELARQPCAKKGANSVGMALSGDLKRVKAVILADMIGQYGVQLAPESSSTKWLVDVVWKTAERLGHKDIFPRREVGAVSDDHDPFLSRGVPAVDIIDLGDYTSAGYWHTPQDTLDKVSPRNVAIVGYVILESVNELQKKFH